MPHAANVTAAGHPGLRRVDHAGAHEGIRRWVHEHRLPSRPTIRGAHDLRLAQPLHHKGAVGFIEAVDLIRVVAIVQVLVDDLPRGSSVHGLGDLRPPALPLAISWRPRGRRQLLVLGHVEESRDGSGPSGGSRDLGRVPDASRHVERGSRGKRTVAQETRLVETGNRHEAPARHVIRRHRDAVRGLRAHELAGDGPLAGLVPDTLA
mmetsp:Transcript_6085/g.17779  ORF Transcript_6085/g.17779 Transcript_6085/m.17779 type:complete len:207 (+) Transcript_6085:547-1167(+)